MMALTLYQPYAWAVAAGYKQWETRSYPYPMHYHRKLLAIHAAQDNRPLELIDAPLRALLRELHPATVEGNYWYGAVLCVVRLMDYLPVERVQVSERERLLGDYSPGRFAWRLQIEELFIPPIPATGAQGFWKWREDVEVATQGILL